LDGHAFGGPRSASERPDAPRRDVSGRARLRRPRSASERPDAPRRDVSGRARLRRPWRTFGRRCYAVAVWVRAAAIRPVPSYARVPNAILRQVEHELADDTAQSRGELDAAFARFERTQPHLADRVSEVLARPLDETALALGYFLSIAVWLGFEKTF